MPRHARPYPCLFLVGWALAAGLAVAAGPPAPPASRPAGIPSALAWGADGRLLVGLRDAREIVEVEPKPGWVARRLQIPARPHSLATTDDRLTWFVGGCEGEVLVIARNGREVHALPPGRGPTRVLPLAGGRFLAASTWDASVRLLDGDRREVVATHPLPFPPGALIRRRDGRVVVADAFAGHLATLTPGVAGSERAFPFDGVNLQALALSGDGKELLIAHMEQDEPAPITVANIDRGAILSSRLSAIRLSDLDRDGDPDDLPPRRQLVLDGPVHGAADPSAMALTPDGDRIVIALAGSHQLLLSDRRAGLATADAADLLPLGHNQRLEVVEVGRSPVALAIDPTGGLAITADSMSDSLTVVTLDGLARLATIPLGEGHVERTPSQRGEALFRDGRRSHDRWMSCASCHPSGHTNGLNFDTEGDGGYGAPKNTPSLLGSVATPPYTWTGTFPLLADQVHRSLRTSLRGSLPPPGATGQIAAYLASLPLPAARHSDNDPAALRGASIFKVRGCVSCHRPPLYTSRGLRDVGLSDEKGQRRFNPPSLRGLSWSPPYFHDGRAATLGAVVDLHSPGSLPPLPPHERADLIAFLESL